MLIEFAEILHDLELKRAAALPAASSRRRRCAELRRGARA